MIHQDDNVQEWRWASQHRPSFPSDARRQAHCWPNSGSNEPFHGSLRRMLLAYYGRSSSLRRGAAKGQKLPLGRADPNVCSSVPIAESGPSPFGQHLPFGRRPPGMKSLDPERFTRGRCGARNNLDLLVCA